MDGSKQINEPLSFLDGADLNAGSPPEKWAPNDSVLDEIIRPVFKGMGMDENSVGELKDHIIKYGGTLHFVREYLEYLKRHSEFCDRNHPKNYLEWIVFCQQCPRERICEKQCRYPRK
jgi:hypothetical protein